MKATKHYIFEQLSAGEGFDESWENDSGNLLLAILEDEPDHFFDAFGDIAGEIESEFLSALASESNRTDVFTSSVVEAFGCQMHDYVERVWDELSPDVHQEVSDAAHASIVDDQIKARARA